MATPPPVGTNKSSTPKPPPAVPARPPQTPTVRAQSPVMDQQLEQDAPKGFLGILAKLFTYNYRASARLQRTDMDMNAIAEEIEQRLQGCDIHVENSGAIIVYHADKHFDLGLFAKIISIIDAFNIFFRFKHSVTMKITKDIRGSVLLVADIQQKSKVSWLMLLPPLLAHEIWRSLWTKRQMSRAVQHLLNDISR